MTVTNVSTLDGYPRLRSNGPAIGCGARACDAVLRLLDSTEANLPAYNLLCRYLSLLDEPGEPRAISLEVALSFRLKLALVAGFAPNSPPAPAAARPSTWRASPGASGGVVCASCEAGSFPLTEEAHRFMVEALAKPLIEAPGRRTARPAPGRAGGRRDPGAPRSCPTARRCIEGELGTAPKIDAMPPATVAFEDRVRAWEDEFLSEDATRSYPAERAVAEPDSPLRTPFQRDRDRIVHSKSFRRLKHKTQVFVAPEGDHYRTRLSHTLEACGIARTVARALGLNEDLTEAIGLGHDLGHPPFGHAGEEDARPLPCACAPTAAASSTTSTRCGWSRCWSATAPAST